MSVLPADVDFLRYCDKYGIRMDLYPICELHGLYNNFRRDKGMKLVTCEEAWNTLTFKYHVVDVTFAKFKFLCNDHSHLSHWVAGAA